MTLCIGKVFMHPTDGPIYIMEGSSEVNGRVSNFWYWRKVNKDGRLGEENRGYGSSEWKPISMKVVLSPVKKKSTPSVARLTILQRIFENFQMATQWPEDAGKVAEYRGAAKSLIELLEVTDCGSTGGYDYTNPRVYKCPDNLYDRFLTVLNKYPTHAKEIKPSACASVDTLTRYYTALSDLRSKVYRE